MDNQQRRVEYTPDNGQEKTVDEMVRQTEEYVDKTMDALRQNLGSNEEAGQLHLNIPIFTLTKEPESKQSDHNRSLKHNGTAESQDATGSRDKRASFFRLQPSQSTIRHHHRIADRRYTLGAVIQSDEICREYDHMVPVEIKTTFLKINDIDTLSQQFEAEMYVQARWEEPALSGMNPRDLDSVMPCDLWDPHLTVLNLAGEFDHERRSFVVRYEEGYEAPVVLHRWRFKGLFREALELRHFPFDVQDLSLQLSTERSVEEIKMKHDPFQLSSVNTKAFQDSQEWSIYKHVECTHRTTTVEYASSTIHPILVFSCRVRRKVGYFMWNIVFIVFLVMMLSFLAIAVEPTSADRLASTMTLFLTMVAFKLVVKQSLPTISYLTYLDIYVLGSLIYLVLFACENSAMNSMGRWMDHNLVDDYDEFFCMMLAALLVVFHLLFIIHIQVTALKRHRQMSENDRHYELQARSIMSKQEMIKKHKTLKK